MNNNKKLLRIVFLIGLIGVSNMAAGILSMMAINSLNLPARILNINSLVDSFDPMQIRTVEVRTSISNIQSSVLQELTSLIQYAKTLDSIPFFFLLNGVLFLLLSSALYLVILEMSPNN
jgi:hypothetical protein